jgi:oxygen-independent coproporphyrinogen-3 oxidase
MAGLYVHVPFCEKKCHYCDFVVTTSTDHGAFLAALEGEARHLRPLLEGTVLDTVYLGGGTPSALGADELERLVGVLRANFRWRGDAEVTCEANPDDVDLEKARRLKDLGVNRVSLGAQSFHDGTLARLNRTHRAADIERSFGALRGAGFRNVNLDLILSLPGETWKEARVSLENLARLDPEHVSGSAAAGLRSRARKSSWRRSPTRVRSWKSGAGAPTSS